MNHLACISAALIDGTKAQTLSGRVLEAVSLLELRTAIEALPTIPAERDLEDFRRGSATVKYSLLAALLAATDAPDWSPERTGALGWNGSGCHTNNLAYWQDYLASNRQNGRGALFVATLPTTPVCEVAITLRLRGPVSYLATARDTQCILNETADWLRSANLRQFLLLEATPTSACALLLQDGGASPLPRATSLFELFPRLPR